VDGVKRLLAPFLLSLGLTVPTLAVAAHASADEPVAKPMSDAKRAKEALRIAARQIGDPYKYGAEGPRRFDCSGLVYFATHRAGFDAVPRTSAEQGAYMRRIKKSHLRRGDFVFFTEKKTVYHVGIYVGRRDGDRMILHAPRTGEKVGRDPIWTDRWFAATLRGV
jgi:cell wall-associated NlpC family hydrolase